MRGHGRSWHVVLPVHLDGGPPVHRAAAAGGNPFPPVALAAGSAVRDRGTAGACPPGPPGSGPPQAREGHLVLLHRSERERLLRLAERVREGIERDEKVVYVEPADAGSDSLVPALHRQGFDVGALPGAGRLRVLAPEVYYAADGQGAVEPRTRQDPPDVRFRYAAGTASRPVGSRPVRRARRSNHSVASGGMLHSRAATSAGTGQRSARAAHAVTAM